MSASKIWTRLSACSIRVSSQHPVWVPPRTAARSLSHTTSQGIERLNYSPELRTLLQLAYSNETLFGFDLKHAKALWLHDVLMPRMRADLGPKTGRASAHCIVLCALLDKMMRESEGLDLAIAATVLLDLRRLAPFKNDEHWCSFLAGALLFP